jgi:hypothetical protein
MRAGLIVGGVLVFGIGVAHQKMRQAFIDHRELRARTRAAQKAKWGFVPPAMGWYAMAGLLFLIAANLDG